MTSSFFSKKIGEDLLLPFDFSTRMSFGETLSVPTVTVSLYSGIDVNLPAILSGVATVSGSVVTQKVIDGMAGVIYVLTASANGSSGAVYKVVQYLAILSDTGSFVPSSVPTLTGSLPDGIVGAVYSAPLQAAGGYMPYTPVGLISGAPAWMGFTVVDDELICAGTPDESVATTYNFSPQIKDAALTSASSAQSIDITRITLSGNLGDGTVGGSPSLTYGATGGTAPYTFVTTISGLPTGTTISSGGVMGGTYTAAGSFNWTVRATDANSVLATLADSNSVTPVLIFAAVDNVLTILKSSDGGLSFTDSVSTGLTTTTSSVCVQSANGRLYHFGASNQGRVSTDAVNFSACTGLMSTPGNAMLIKVSGTSEYLLGDVIELKVSTDGQAFSSRASAGFGVAKPVQAGSGAVVLGIVGGRFLNLSQDFGATWAIYSVDPSISANEGIQFVIWTGSKFILFANGPSDAAPSLLIGTSTTGLSGSWTVVAGPETGVLSSVCHGVARDPNTGRILMVLRNGNSWYTDNEAGSWTAGAAVTYGSPANYPPAPGNNMIFAGGGFLFAATQGGGVTNINRTTNGVVAWTESYNTGPTGNAINSLAAF